jgi:hypothetical protein
MWDEFKHPERPAGRDQQAQLIQPDLIKGRDNRRT